MATNRSNKKARARGKVSGLRSLRTAVKARMRTKPQVEGQEHLDTYALTRDRARWGRMGEQCAEMLRGIDKEVEKIKQGLSDAEDAQEPGKPEERPKERPEKKLGMFRLDY